MASFVFAFPFSRREDGTRIRRSFRLDAEELLTANEDDFLIIARFIRRRHGFRVKERERRETFECAIRSREREDQSSSFVVQMMKKSEVIKLIWFQE